MRNAAAVSSTNDHPWKREFDDLVRGLCGGFLFGIPLLYTMEVWWLGTHSEHWRLLVILLFSFAVNWMLSYFAGFRKASPAMGGVTEALEAMALGVVAAAATLLVLGELHPALPLDTIVGKIAIESVPFGLGVSIANGLLGGAGQGNEGAGEGRPTAGAGVGGDAAGQDAGSQERQLSPTLLDAGATVAGALFVCLSVAPTEEIPMLEGNLSPWWLIALIFFSLIVSYAITFEAGFVDQQARMNQQGIFQQPLSETVFSYLLSLIVAAILLWLFKQLEFGDPWHVWLGRSVVLGLPAAIGGSAGRLAIGG